MIPDPHPLNVREIEGGHYYARGVLFEIAAICFYEDDYARHNGSMISFWATRTDSERGMIKQWVESALNRCSKGEST